MMRFRVLAGSAVLLVASIAGAGVLAPKKPSETVILTNSPFSGPCLSEQVATQIDTQGNEVPFALELGKTLMITDINWMLENGTAGETVGLEFYSGASDIAFMSVDGEVNAGGIARGRVHFQTPIQLTDVLCATPVVMQGSDIPDVDELRVLGFITNDR